MKDEDFWTLHIEPTAEAVLWVYRAEVEQRRWWGLSVAAFALLAAVCLKAVQ
ncbi:MAG TPA: hypothetical protein VK989_19790 [Polyangia bacterium]|jgi:hypothetical protein|nr:hypothetical protein [Polyangia bacterium]